MGYLLSVGGISRYVGSAYGHGGFQLEERCLTKLRHESELFILD